ncbi:MAG: HD-GYP domain-containing protein (c-di-GMP phosphodiesterase class II), partial [Bradymonadia bacterium]
MGKQDTSAEQPVAATVAQQRDRARRKATVQCARRFLVHMDSLSRQLKVHAENNSAVRESLNALMADFDLLVPQQGATTIVFVEGHCFVNGVWVRSSGRAWQASLTMTERLLKRNAQGARLAADASPAALLAFARWLRESDLLKEPQEERVETIGVPGVLLLLLPEEVETTADRAEFRDAAQDIFRDALLALDRRASQELTVYQRRRQRALVLKLVQMAEETPEDLLILTTVRDATLPSVAHNLMVGVLAIAMGRLMDLRRRDLVRLGVCALNHNIGESLLPIEVVDPPAEAVNAVEEHAQTHPLIGMKHLLEVYGFEIPIVERALASAEHHLSFDGRKGFPMFGHEAPHVFSRIIGIADTFNSLVAERTSRLAFPPDQGMKLILRKSDDVLDPLFVRLFVKMIGRYPPGSLVELDTGEYGVVIGPGAGLDPLARPRVLLLTDEDGLEITPPTVVDLGERHSRRRAWLRTIVRTRDPRQLASPVSRYLFADRLEEPPAKLDKDDSSVRRQ